MNIMKFALAQVTFSLANSQFADNSGHSLPPGLRVPDSVRNQFKTLSKDEKRIPGKIWAYRGSHIRLNKSICVFKMTQQNIPRMQLSPLCSQQPLNIAKL